MLEPNKEEGPILNDMWLASERESSPTNPSVARHQDTLFSEAGAWTQEDPNVDSATTTGGLFISPSTSPVQARPGLHCDTHQSPPSINYPQGHYENEEDSTLSDESRCDSARGSNDFDDSSLPDSAAGDQDLEEDDTFYSAQSSQVWESSSITLGLVNSTRDEQHKELVVKAPERDLLYLGIPRSSTPIVSEAVRGRLSREHSVISDGGDQEQLRQEQHSSAAAPPSIVHGLSSHKSRWKLQKMIFDQLKQSAVALNPSKPLFLPRDQLRRVINEDTVRDELRTSFKTNYNDTKIYNQMKSVCFPEEVEIGQKLKFKSFRKIFAILVLLDMTSSIQHFIKENVSDLDLPLAAVLEPEKRTIVGFRRRDASNSASDQLLECFGNNWSFTRLLDFEARQWIMLAPYFSQGEKGEIRHYILQDNHILPFTDCDEKSEYHGGFAKVMMVDIHPDHYNFKNMTMYRRGFAIKQLYKDSREAFDKERSILKRFSGHRGHEHIVSLLATYEQHNKYHLIFHRAEGDLFKLWDTIPNPACSFPNLLWMARQCAGVADALMHLHKHLTILSQEDVKEAIQHATSDDSLSQDFSRKFSFVRTETMQSSGARVPPDSPTWQPRPGDLQGMNYTDSEIIIEGYGRHGDIDPANILWYSGTTQMKNSLSGILKIADFGQATINSQHSKTTKSSIAIKETYHAPEYDIMPRYIRQSYDIWCLGCVFLEFATWMIGGTALLKEFAVKRRARDGTHSDMVTDKFFELTPNSDFEPRLKPTVVQFIDQLHCHGRCTNFLHDLLNVIQGAMLVANSTERMQCGHVKAELDRLLEYCRKDPAYASKQTPWPIGNGSTFKLLSTTIG